MMTDDPYDDDRYQKGRHLARVVRRGTFDGLTRDPNVVATAYGRRIVDDVRTDEPALVVYVMRKVSERFLPTTSLLPRRVYVGRDALAVDVVETGPIYPLSFTGQVLPVPYGVTVGHFNVTAGTFGAVVNDLTDNSRCVLSNNHILADTDKGSIGDVILHPAPFDGGLYGLDNVAMLKRFVPIQPTGNVVDAAIGELIRPNVAVDHVMNDLIPIATAAHPALGLLFAGGCNRTFMNPIDSVLTALNVEFTNGAGVTATVNIGDHLEKVGRTTEYTTSTVTEIDVDGLQINYGTTTSPDIRTFDNQIATAWMADGGDSGSVIYRGGAGGDENHCFGCITVREATAVVGRDFQLDAAIERDFRNKYLMQTRVGRFAVESYFSNEERLTERSRNTVVAEDDRRFFQNIYDQFVNVVRPMLLNPHQSTVTLNPSHLQIARNALERGRKYLRANEIAAFESGLQIATEALGKNATQVLEMLDGEALLERTQEIVASVDFLRPEDR
jgi:hypothetical protein